MNALDNLRVVIGGKVLKSNYPLVRAKAVSAPNYDKPGLALRQLDGRHIGEQLVAAGFKPGDEVLIVRVPVGIEQKEDTRLRKRVLAVMEPGHYYDWREIAGLVARADGDSPQRVKIVVEQLVREGGVVERRSGTGRVLGVEIPAAPRTTADEYAAAHCLGDDPARPE